MLGSVPGLIFPLLPAWVLRKPGLAPSCGKKAAVCRWAHLRVGSWPRALRGPRPGPARHQQPCLSPQSTVPELSYLSVICVFCYIAGHSIGPSEYRHPQPSGPSAWCPEERGKYLLNEWMSLALAALMFSAPFPLSLCKPHAPLEAKLNLPFP